MPSLGGIFHFWLTDGPRGIGLDEIDDFHHRLVIRKNLGHVLKPFAHRAFLGENQPVGLSEVVDIVARKIAALEADNVKPRQARPVADDGPIGNDVVGDAGFAADHGVLTDPDELMDRRQPADDCPFLDRDVPPQGGVVDHDDVIADLAVMGDMGADHEQTVVADAGHHAAPFGARVHGHVFPNNVVAADFQARRLAVVFLVLGLVADGGKGKYPGVGTDGGAAADHDMGDQLDAVAEFDLGAYCGIRADGNVLADFGVFVDDGGLVNIGHFGSTIMAEKTASATRLSSTRASPLNFHILGF